MFEYREKMRDYRKDSEPTPEMLRRVAERVKRQRQPSWGPWLGGLAAAAVLVWMVWPPQKLEGPLLEGEQALGPKVQVQSNGTGRVHGNIKQMEIDWQQGSLSLEVMPNQGIQLAVITDEATVRVLGTGFTVNRSALGTEVEVRHGIVSVVCAVGGEVKLQEGEKRTCLPSTAAGALGRARQLEGQLSPEGLLLELDAALARADAVGAVASELASMRTSTLLSLGREQEALETAERALALDGGTRSVELHRVAARLRVKSQDCAAALPHLLALEAQHALGEDEGWLVYCQQKRP